MTDAKLIIITAIITTVIVLGWSQLYYARVIKPVDEEQKENEFMPLFQLWKDFITANINSCFTRMHCEQCFELVRLFELKFSRDLSKEIVGNEVNNMCNRLNTKYKIINELSETTYNDLIK